jgi:hypothetical protein
MEHADELIKKEKKEIIIRRRNCKSSDGILTILFSG